MVFVDMLTLAYVLRQRYQQSCTQAVQTAARNKQDRQVAIPESRCASSATVLLHVPIQAQLHVAAV